MRTLPWILALALSTTLLAATAVPAFADGEGKGGGDDARDDPNETRSEDKRHDRDGNASHDDDDGDDDDDDKSKDDKDGRGKRKGHLEWRAHGGDKWLLRNDNVSVWFHAGGNGKAKPQLRVFHTDEDGNRSGYSVAIKRIVELGEDGKVEESLKLADMDDWNVRTVETNTTLTITMVRAEAQGIVTLVFHVSKTSPSVKFDVKIDNWAWEDDAANHTLGLVLVAHERSLREAGAGNATLDGGFISWAPTATVSYGSVSRVVNVTASTDREDKHGRLTLVFDAPGGYSSLDYDPTFGVVETASADAQERSVPGAPLAIALAGVAVAALTVRKRK